MSMERLQHPVTRADIVLNVTKGHFATGHSHINYYIDVTAQKFCLSEARRVALALAREYRASTLIDTILCLDGTEVIAACMASEMTKTGYMNINQNQDMNVLILMASVSTGYTAKSAIETIAYYGGRAVGIASIFATVDSIGALPVTSLFNPKDLPGYTTSDAAACPLCKAGQKLDAIVNSFGYSKL